MKFRSAVVSGLAVIAVVVGVTGCEDLSTDQPGTAADRADTKNAAKKDTKAKVDTKTKAKSHAKPAAESITEEAIASQSAQPKPKPATPKETAGEAQARETAAEYLDYSAFSRSGLIDQLSYEGFTKAEATYGTDAQHANWNEQAALAAKEYLDYDHFSHSGLVDQLMYEGYTREQAEYGVKKVGL